MILQRNKESLVSRLEILLGLDGVGFHLQTSVSIERKDTKKAAYGLLARLPANRADFTILVGVLVALDEAKNLINTASNGGIVHADVTDNTLSINDESSSNYSELGMNRH